MSVAIRFDRVSVVFGPRPGPALALLDQGSDRAAVFEATGQTLGVHECSLEVAAGECVVLMGLSGSGKSTLLRTVNGLLPVTRGSVAVNDGGRMVTIGDASPAQLRQLRRTRIAMVFQQFALLPWRSVAENVGLGLELAGVPPADRAGRVAEQLDLVGLTDWGNRRVAELSGGMQQRVGLARALATAAPILLMDEPFSALDPLIRRHLQDDLLAVQARLRRSILFVSHDLDEAFRIGNRIALMAGGRLVQVGTARQIMAAPANAEVAAFIAGINPLDVLTAADVLVPGLAAEGAPLAPDTPLRQVLARLATTPGPLPVVDAGRLLGVVTPAAALARLGRPC